MASRFIALFTNQHDLHGALARAGLVPVNEVDASKFADIADVRVREHFPETNLKRLRTNYGCSQAELSRLSGVSLRSIQMYEQRNKDINKASAETVHALSRALGCWMEDLLER